MPHLVVEAAKKLEAAVVAAALAKAPATWTAAELAAVIADSSSKPMGLITETLTYKAKMAAARFKFGKGRYNVFIDLTDGSATYAKAATGTKAAATATMALAAAA